MSDQAPAPEATPQGNPLPQLAPPNSSTPRTLCRNDIVRVINGPHRKTVGRIGDRNGDELWIIVAGCGEISIHPQDLEFMAKCGAPLVRE